MNCRCESCLRCVDLYGENCWSLLYPLLRKDEFTENSMTMEEKENLKNIEKELLEMIEEDNVLESYTYEKMTKYNKSMDNIYVPQELNENIVYYKNNVLNDSFERIDSSINNIWSAFRNSQIKSRRIINLLVEYPELINARDESFLNWTPLHFAAEQCDIKLLGFLLKNDVEIDSLDKSCQTPLLIASKKGSCVAVGQLLKNGANINHQDDIDETALHKAVWNSHLVMVEFLIGKGADHKLLNHINETPLCCALKKYKKDHTPIQRKIINFLRYL